MSNQHLPPEIVDHIVDDLHEETQTLRDCCLVAKSWVSRTRKHLFGDIKLTSSKVLESWKNTFPDPSNSPARHTLALIIDCPEVITAADAEEGGWIQAFSRVVHLVVRSCVKDGTISFAPLYGFSPILKSLHVSSPMPQGPQLSGLVLSFPLLEDLTLICRDQFLNEGLNVTQADVPETSPPFTGSLEIQPFGGLGITARRLLDLPNGLHFRIFGFAWIKAEDIRWTADFLTRCSHTLERLYIVHQFCASALVPSWTFYSSSIAGDFGSASVDLSKAIKLKAIVFRVGSLTVGSITMALRTITPEHRDLRLVSISVDTALGFISPNIEHGIPVRLHEQWSDLDRLLVQFLESGLVCPKVIVCSALKEEMREMRDSLGWFLPRAAERGLIELSPT